MTSNVLTMKHYSWADEQFQVKTQFSSVTQNTSCMHEVLDCL